MEINLQEKQEKRGQTNQQRQHQRTHTSTSSDMIQTASSSPYLLMNTPMSKSRVRSPTSRTATSITTAITTQPTVYVSIHNPERSVQLCRYPSKLCGNLRSEKRGGGLHRFCAYHRERANINQRRVDHRRRLRRQGLPVPPIERGSTPSTPTTPTSATSYSTMTIKQEPVMEHDESATEQDEVETQDELQKTLESGDLFDEIDTASQPLLPDFSEYDLQQLMDLLDKVDAAPATTINENERHVQQAHKEAESAHDCI